MTESKTYEPIFWDIETSGLNPLAQHWWNGKVGAQVTCVVFGSIDGWREAQSYEDAEYKTKVLWDSDEYRLLKLVKERLDEFITDKIGGSTRIAPFLVGWNCRNFDHPYIGARYARKRLECDTLNHALKRLDMMRALGNDEVMDTPFPKQDDYAKELDIPVDDSVEGSDMVEAFKAEDWDTIAGHGESDVIEMMKVFVEKKEACLEEFYNHYDDIDLEPPKFVQEVDF